MNVTIIGNMKGAPATPDPQAHVASSYAFFC